LATGTDAGYRIVHRHSLSAPPGRPGTAGRGRRAGITSSCPGPTRS